MAKTTVVCVKCGWTRTPQRCDECARRRAKRWYHANKTRAKKARAEYYRNNMEAAKARAVRHAKKNRKTIREVNRLRRAQNLERYRNYSRTWRKKHPEKNADWSARYRARKRKAKIEKVDRELIFLRDGKKCYICRVKLYIWEMHLDHVIPLSKGGEHSNRNCKCACATCNLKKGAKLNYHV